MWDLIFCLIQRNLKLKPSPFDIDTVKHLIGIAAGVVPGFASATDNFAGPVKEWQKIYADIYQLKYDPIILQPTFYSIYKPERPVYYSLQYPSTIEFSPRAMEMKSILGELYIVKTLLEKCLSVIARNEFNIETTPFYDVTRLAEFDTFHRDPGDYRNIYDCRNIQDEDKTFKSLLKDYAKYEFPVNSAFLKGCFRISSKKTS